MEAAVEKPEYVIECIKHAMKHRHWSVHISRQPLPNIAHTGCDK